MKAHYMMQVVCLFILLITGSNLLTAQQFEVLNRPGTLVSSTRSTRTHFVYEYRVQIVNNGGAASDVRATVASNSPETAIVEGELAFGNVGAGATVPSQDTYTIRHNRAVPFNPLVLSFQFRTGMPENVRPTAVANAVPFARPGSTVQLDGSRSSDPDGSITQYLWTQIDGPPAPPEDRNAAVTTVLLPVAGVYRYRLVVTDNGGLTDDAEVTIRTGPVANPGPAQTVRVGETVQLDGTGSFDPEGLPLEYMWRLTCPQGSTCVLSNAGAERPTFLADVEGSYTATLTVRTSVASSEPMSVVITAIRGPFICGDLITGSIDAAAEVDQLQFLGQAGDRITLTLAQGGFPAFVAARATLFSPAGEPLLTFDANSQQQVTLDATGTYIIQVRASNLVSTGSYTLGLECLLPTSPVDGTLACGDLMPGTIESPAEVDQLTFAGQAGQKVTLTLVQAGFPAFVAARATLFSPAGEPLLTFDANSQHQVTLGATGTYIVQVRASNLVSTGSYTLGLECLLPTSPVDATLACGGLISGAVESPAEVDQLTFAGQAGRRVTLTLVQAGFPAFVAARATLFSPAGEPLLTFDANSQRQVTLDATGTYVIQVRASNLVSTGSYTLGLECLLPTNPVGGTPACGDLMPGAIESPAEVDQLTFAGQAGRRVTLTLVQAGFPAFVAARATLFSPAGEPLLTFDANSQQQLTLDATGTYIIQVRASNLVSTGSYTLGLECLLPTNPVDGTLSCGGLIPGGIESPAEVDQFTFAGQAGRRVTLTLVQAGFPAFVAARATLFSPAGEPLLTFDANSQQQVTLGATGTYIVQVRASNLVSTGSYTLGLECLLPTSPVDATLACGGLISGAIESPAEVDQLTFAGQAGRRVTLTLAQAGFPAFVAARATLFSPAGEPSLTFDANSQQQITLDAGGAYIIQLRASNLVSSGTYNLGLQCP